MNINDDDDEDANWIIYFICIVDNSDYDNDDVQFVLSKMQTPIHTHTHTHLETKKEANIKYCIHYDTRPLHHTNKQTSKMKRKRKSFLTFIFFTNFCV